MRNVVPANSAGITRSNVTVSLVRSSERTFASNVRPEKVQCLRIFPSGPISTARLRAPFSGWTRSEISSRLESAKRMRTAAPPKSQRSVFTSAIAGTASDPVSRTEAKTDCRGAAPVRRRSNQTRCFCVVFCVRGGTPSAKCHVSAASPSGKIFKYAPGSGAKPSPFIAGNVTAAPGLAAARRTFARNWKPLPS